MVQGRGEPLAADLQPPTAFLNRQVETAGHLGERRQEQVAERVAGQITVGEAVLEQAPHERLVRRQCHQAVADVARRQDPQLAPQPPRRSAVVGDRDDRGQIDRGALEAAQQRGEAGPATQGGDAGPSAHGAPPAPVSVSAE